MAKVRNRSFSPLSFILFRLFLLLFGNHNFLSYWIKVAIRKVLIVGERPEKKSLFTRKFYFKEDSIYVEDLLKGIRGDFCTGFDFSVRYVPQSRYFQEHEMSLGPEKLQKTKEGHYILKSQWHF